MTRPGIERRRAARAKAEFSIRLAERDGMRPARLKDLSTSGLCCYFGEAMREMTLLRIALEIPGAVGTHEVQGAVVRCAKLRDVSPPTYEIAIFFTQLPAACRQAIHDFVAAQVTAV
ncbi:MAG: PilZ domain-containing protein [Planctomycetota bacterium]